MRVHKKAISYFLFTTIKQMYIKIKFSFFALFSAEKNLILSHLPREIYTLKSVRFISDRTVLLQYNFNHSNVWNFNNFSWFSLSIGLTFHRQLTWLCFKYSISRLEGLILFFGLPWHFIESGSYTVTLRIHSH